MTLNYWTADIGIMWIDEDGDAQTAMMSKDFPSVKDAMEGLTEIIGQHPGASSEYHICVRWKDLPCMADEVAEGENG